MHEMETLQRRMEELQRQYMKDKETYRLQLVSSLLAARKTQVSCTLEIMFGIVKSHIFVDVLS
jgi:hypothetical protein